MHWKKMTMMTSNNKSDKRIFRAAYKDPITGEYECYKKSGLTDQMARMLQKQTLMIDPEASILILVDYNE